jgi:sulfopropanediol 3-dehydrogenase
MPHYLKQAPMYDPQLGEEVRRRVSDMLSTIERRGIDAIRDYSRQLDNWAPDSFLVDQDEVQRAGERLSDELRGHIAIAQDNVRRFAELQLATLSELDVELHPGIVLGHRLIPIQTVGSYVPGGRYPMLASSFMTIIPAKVAGVGCVIAAAPPQAAGGVHPAMLHAIATSGADQILCLGGVQALAAIAFGLIDGVPAADMVCGAGNAYVAEAKRQLHGRIGIDLLAGPTEIAIIANESADPALIAADLLGQAEHGPSSPAVLITTSPTLGKSVLAAVDRLLETWPTAAVAGAAWRAHGSIVVVADRREAVELSDSLAPEHLEVHVDDQQLDWYLAELHNYGSLFLGPETTVAFGDKAVGCNHVLPTVGAARYTGGLWAGKFVKTCTYSRLTAEGVDRIAPTVAAICDAERMEGHGLTALMRLDRLMAGARS